MCPLPTNFYIHSSGLCVYLFNWTIILFINACESVSFACFRATVGVTGVWLPFSTYSFTLSSVHDQQHTFFATYSDTPWHIHFFCLSSIVYHATSRQITQICKYNVKHWKRVIHVFFLSASRASLLSGMWFKWKTECLIALRSMNWLHCSQRETKSIQTIIMWLKKKNLKVNIWAKHERFRWISPEMPLNKIEVV